MASLIIDKSRLSSMLNSRRELPTSGMLYRDNGVFFVGGALPVYETLETMFNSFCLEATDLFYLTLGAAETWSNGEEMARQIKKNFNIRLVARLDDQNNPLIVKRLYAAGVDNLDIRLSGVSSVISPLLMEAKAIFPEWGVAATVHVDPELSTELSGHFELFLKNGIFPLIQLPLNSGGCSAKALTHLIDKLVQQWDESSVPLRTYLPLVRVILPLVQARPGGMITGIVNRLVERHKVASSDIRRHLRVQLAENSLDSAGL